MKYKGKKVLAKIVNVKARDYLLSSRSYLMIRRVLINTRRVATKAICIENVQDFDYEEC